MNAEQWFLLAVIISGIFFVGLALPSIMKLFNKK